MIYDLWFITNKNNNKNPWQAAATDVKQVRPGLLFWSVLLQPILRVVVRPLFSKLLEALLSAAVLVVVIYDMVVRFKQEMNCLSVFYVLFWLMILTLLCTFQFT